MMGLMMVVVVVSQSKNCQKVEELSKVKKPQRLEKSAKAISSEEPSFLTSDTRLAFTKRYSQWKTASTVEAYKK